MREERDDHTLTRLLVSADLVPYEPDMRKKLKLRNAADLQYVEEIDLTSIGMSRPEQKRLRKEYAKMYPSGIFGKVKKVFKRSESLDRKATTTTVGNREDENHHVIPIEKITLCKELGQGEFGSVWQASWKNSSNEAIQVAVKCVGSDKLLASSTSFLQEAAIMTRMRHEHVVRLYGVVLDTRKIMMVSELATCGSLLECLHKPALRDSFPVHVLCDYAEQIALGMSYLESQRLIHRDLAARNVLVFSPKLVKISDFGLSRSLGVGEDYYKSEFTPTLKLPIAWCAPECINFLKFTSKSDVWAYGVTVWEMFSYGEMPWKNKSGAQILELIDRKKELLRRPVSCPEDIYDMLKETWTHQYTDRPTFADIVAQFPERRAQSVRAVVDCRDTAPDHLHFKKDDLIVVISRSPKQYPDGYYWFGSLRNGKLGLFRPSDTVAHLGSEPPCSNGSLDSGFIEKKESGGKKKKSDGKKTVDKEGERERRKMMISEPVGDVRHTCHVGMDGTAFGLLQLDKKSLGPTTSTSPSTTLRGNGCQASPAPSHTSSSSSVHLRETVARNGVPLRETMSLRDVGPLSRDAANLRDTISPPILRAPSQPPLYSQPRISSKSSTNSTLPYADDDMGSFERSRGSLTPTAPPLTASAANSLKMPFNGQFTTVCNGGEETFDDDRCSPTTTSTTIASFSSMIGSRRAETTPVPAPRGPIAAVYARGQEIPSKVILSKSDQKLCDEIGRLDRDLTNYSINTIYDYSDDRPLIGKPAAQQKTEMLTAKISKRVTNNDESNIRMMSENEMQKMMEKSIKEHQKADECLKEERIKERKYVASIGEKEEGKETNEDEENGSSQLLALQRQQEGWSSAAQEAYKLLVECGTSLKQTSVSPTPPHQHQNLEVSSSSSPSRFSSTLERGSLSPPRPATPPLNVRNEVISMRSSPVEQHHQHQQQQIEHVRIEENSPKRVHIIETKLIDGPARGMSPVQDRPIPAFTTPMSSLNRKAALPTPPNVDSRPPPVPPPKTRNFPLIIDERNMAYDNLNGIGAGARVAPPVPPKPKVSFADDRFAMVSPTQKKIDGVVN